MPVYKYRALDVSDNVVENNLKALTLEDAKQIVKEKGFIPIKVEEVTAVDDLGADLFKKIKLKDIVVFCRQMAIVIKSGINITLGLDILRKQSEKSFKRAVQQIDLEVQKGRTLAQAMRETDLKFPELLIRMISTGEASGNLDSVLDNMGDYYEKENYIKQKIKSALIYPIILIVIAIGLMLFFANFILPSMNELLSGQTMPLLTKIVLGFVEVLVSKYTLIVIGLLIASFIGIKKFMPNEKYRKVRDSIILKIPILGSVVRDFVTVRFLNTLYLLLRSGMDIVNVLEIVKKVMSNYNAETAIEYAIDGVKRGEKLGDMISQTNFFEPLVIQMISVGEETGELERILSEISRFYEKRLELKIERVISLMEPLFTLIIGGSIGIIIFAMAMPIFNMTGTLDTSGAGLGLE